MKHVNKGWTGTLMVLLLCWLIPHATERQARSCKLDQAQRPQVWDTSVVCHTHRAHGWLQESFSPLHGILSSAPNQPGAGSSTLSAHWYLWHLFTSPRPLHPHGPPIRLLYALRGRERSACPLGGACPLLCSYQVSWCGNHAPDFLEWTPVAKPWGRV